MIRVKVENDLDLNRNGEYIFYFNSITVGSNIDSQLYFPNNNISDKHLLFEISKTGHQAILTGEAEYFHVNGKRTLKSKSITTGSIIEFNQIKIQILDISFTEIITTREALNKITQEEVPNNPNLAELLLELTK